MNRIRAVIGKIEKTMEQFSDYAASFAAHPVFLILHVMWFTLWILFDAEEFPFGLLTMLVSLEAILLSSLILSSTNRASDRDRQTLIRNLKQTKETNERLEEIHEDIQDIIEILEEEI